MYEIQHNGLNQYTANITKPSGFAAEKQIRKPYKRMEPVDGQNQKAERLPKMIATPDMRIFMGQHTFLYTFAKP